MGEAAPDYISPEEYLAIERAAKEKSEYWNGRMYAMAGGKPPHNRVSVNVSSDLNSKLRNTPCLTFNSDQRLLIDDTGLYTYPDISVACGEPQFFDGDCLQNPILIVEVLSPSTSSYDRGGKFAHYRRILSLKEVVFISSEHIFIEVFRRDNENRWMLEEVSDLGGSFFLESVQLMLNVKDIYDKVNFEEAAPLRPEIGS
jgi:Uma2 family endonuclease